MKSTTIGTSILNGRVILLQKNKALFSPVFFGNIFPKGNGEELISQLSQIYSEKQFRKYIESFSRREYGHFDSAALFSAYSMKDFTDKGVIDFRALNYETTFFADWLYFKNIGQTAVKMIFRNNESAILENRDTIATRTGTAIPYPQKTMIKTKDTIKSILLIEKIN